jgi:UDP-4-amino-4-deoxy-L-arabinose-oxoglutarate aminotransferase
LNWILHSKPWITKEDKAGVLELLSSGMIGQGSRVVEFESVFSKWVGGEGGVCVSSGTAALYLALQALKINSKHEVILPTYICESLLAAIVATGARPIFCDSGPNWVIEAKVAAKLLSDKTAAILVPHLYGIHADVKSFRKLGVPIIEDCTQAVSERTPTAPHGDISIYSFHPTKCLTTGEGGIAVSSNQALIKRMRVISEGSGLRMSDLQASLGLTQLKRYPQHLEKRQEIAKCYLAAFIHPEQRLIISGAMAGSMYFRFPIKISGGHTKYKKAFEKRKIHVRRGVDKLVHRHLNYSDRKFPVAVELFNTTISLPIYPALTSLEITRCVQALGIFT